MRVVIVTGAGLVLTGLGLALSAPAALAQQVRTVAILMPGKGGPIPGDVLVRNRDKFSAAGIETRVTTSPAEAAEIARTERQKGRKVVIVGMSLGARHAVQAVAAGAPLNGLVLVSGVLGGAASTLGSPAKLPPTLIVHHRRDACIYTPASEAASLQQWSGGRARVVWIDTQPRSATPPTPVGPVALNDPCGPFVAAHGFYMQDGGAIRAIIGFIRSR
jgi:dienelactone hydrolase